MNAFRIPYRSQVFVLAGIFRASLLLLRGELTWVSSQNEVCLYFGIVNRDVMMNDAPIQGRGMGFG